MGLKLEKVVPWGRSLHEYLSMFHLTARECQLQILDCAGGPSSFNVEMTRQGNQVLSCDPIYQFSPEEISQRIQETYHVIVEGVKAHSDSYLWLNFESPEQLGQVRMATMQQFLEDLPVGLTEGRYLTAELPVLPFAERQFDLALCSHFLFTYSDHFSEQFHLKSIQELCRVAQEVRIFPLLNISGELSPLLSPLLQTLTEQGYSLEIEAVEYEFQKGGNQMLRVRTEQSYQ
ncbi:MAG: SAM-dependent methyltransferase [Actinomycetota bacterium]